MDPWYYNRLGNSSASFQPGNSTSTNDYHQQLTNQAVAAGNAVPSTSSQLFLQAAHNSNLATPSPFNPAGFLTPNPVYDVFPPLFSHAHTKASPYSVSQHRALAIASSKSSSDSELSSLRENYSPAHHQNLASAGGSFFEHQNSVSNSIGWPHQTPTQLPSPFGILPHESVSTQSAGASAVKGNTSDYSSFNPYTTAHNLNHLSSVSDYKSLNYSDAKKASRSQSPLSSSKVPLPGSSALSSFYPGSSEDNAGSNYGGSSSSSGGAYSSTSKYSAPNQLQQHQSCIVTSQSGVSSSKDYRPHQSTSRTSSSNIYQASSASREKLSSSRPTNFASSSNKSSQDHSLQSKPQTKGYADLGSSSEPSRRSEAPLEASQSSPISLSMMDSSSHRYPSGTTTSATNSSKQLAPSSQSHQAYNHALNHQAAAYRLYPNTGSSLEGDFHRSKSSSVDSAYNTAAQQNGAECIAVPRRTSPLSSQSSPHGHVPSPAYPMYNSPMAPLPSPSPHQVSESTTSQYPNNSSSYKASSQVNPITALDVSITRSQSVQPQNVGYPSVITRALSTPDPVAKQAVYSDTRQFDRVQEPNPYSKQCWDSGSERQPSSQQHNVTPQQRKYPASNSTTSFSLSGSNITSNLINDNLPPRVSQSTSERQHPYYDSMSGHQVPAPDLSSCRGDPMTIVKNLHNLQQQSCQIQPADDQSRMGIKVSNASNNVSSGGTKRRKSVDKQAQAASSTDYYSGRIPPPAHHNTPAQQQPNGSYFSNYLTSPSTSRPYVGTQTSAHHASNPLMGNQHQGLYGSAYFQPFHLPGTSSNPTANNPSASTASHTSVLAQEYGSPSLNQSAQFSESQLQPSTSSLNNPPENAVQERIPKVIVPNIEEELSFLANVGPVVMTKLDQEKKNLASSGFEASYLKFLQGERETSPPPSNRGSRKTTWERVKSYLPEPLKAAATDTPFSNGTSQASSVTPVPAIAAKETTPVYDPEDDPRYFPLPKTDDQRKSLDSSESESEPDISKTKLLKSQNSKSPGRKPVAAVAPRTASKTVQKTSSKTAIATVSQPAKRGRKKKLEAPVPRRETSKRKAKEKGSFLLEQEDDLFPDESDKFADSDSDPAWTPVGPKVKVQSAVDSSDDEIGKKKSHKRAMKYSGSGRKRSKHFLSDDECASSEDEAIKISKRPSSGSRGRRRSQYTMGASGNSNSVKSGDDCALDGDDADMYPFKVGDFVVMKSDLSEQWPAIWRVDGKTLLQKFEPFDSKDTKLYRNISTYSGWSLQNRHIYRTAHVKFIAETRLETIVEFLRDEMTDDDDQEVLENLMKETARFQENFEVYIQTLISQALDSNFLTEIFQEQDEYFLSNVKAIDDIVDDKRQSFLLVAKWRPELEASIATWPCYNVIVELVDDELLKICAACNKFRVSARVLLYGQPYNSTTLEGCQPDAKLISEKDFLTCRRCLTHIELYNKIAHQKYLMFIECAKRVGEKRAADTSKDTTAILNDLLADEKWLIQLFRNVRQSWAEIDRIKLSGKKQ